MHLFTQGRRTLAPIFWALVLSFSAWVQTAHADSWTPSTSEEAGENSPASCGDGLATGFRCSGRYCDNVSLQCGDNVRRTDAQWSRYFSEEGSERFENEHICPEGQYIDGVRCQGRYCDGMSVRCVKAPELKNLSCTWKQPLSEEHGGAIEFGAGAYLRGLKCTGRYCDRVESLVCMTEKPTCDSPECRADQARRFAPILRFDQEQGQENKCFPSDAGEYFDKRKSGSKERICNTDVRSIENNQIPIYYAYQDCSGDTTVIMYWFFYGYQDTCSPGLGSHPADWERVAVKIRDGRLERVLYYQHGGNYTRQGNSFEVVDGTHPVAYIGKNSHGSYHDDGGSGSCLYFEDYRNPGGPNMNMKTWNNLVELRTGPDAPEWMRYDGKDYWDGMNGPLHRGVNLCSLQGCSGKDFKVGAICTGQCGCSKSSIGDAPF